MESGDGRERGGEMESESVREMESVRESGWEREMIRGGRGGR